MSATDELRRLLDERGVAHSDHYLSTTWRDRHGMKHLASEPMADGSLVVDMLTPEQAIAATLDGGKLRAEQVRKTVEKHWHDLPAEYDMPEATALPEYSYDWQAIADELNATLGGGECEMVETDRYTNSRETIHVLECSKCGKTCEHVNGIYPRCPHCGKAVKR